MKDVLNATQTVASACLLLLGLQGLFGSVAPAVSSVTLPSIHLFSDYLVTAERGCR